MDKTIIQALNGLIPSLNGPLPPDLVDLALSLLAQSRNKASSLKAEEEIARSYACAHIACERLKLSLGLPQILPRPPCPPRIYQKLYRYLDSALTTGARARGRPPKHIEDTPSTSPAKTRTPAKSTAPRSYASRSKTNASQPTFAREIPPWVMPLIRHLCKAFNAPAAPPHVFAGVSSILTLPAPSELDHKPPPDSGEQINVPALIIVVYLLVATRLTGVATPPEEFIRQRTLAIAAIRNSEVPEAVAEVTDDTSAAARIMNWMREISRNRWTELDWFANVREGSGLGLSTKRIDGEEDLEDDDRYQKQTTSIVECLDLDEDENPDVLRPGLGTMMQDRVDYLSERRQAEYREWKKGILARIQEVKHAQQTETSAVSEVDR